MSSRASIWIRSFASGKSDGDGERGFLSGWRRRRQQQGPNQQAPKPIFRRFRRGSHGMSIAAAVAVGSASVLAAAVAAHQQQQAEEHREQKSDDRALIGLSDCETRTATVTATDENQSSTLLSRPITSPFHALLDHFSSNKAGGTATAETTPATESEAERQTQSSVLANRPIGVFSAFDWHTPTNVTETAPPLAPSSTSSATTERVSPSFSSVLNPAWLLSSSALSVLPLFYMLSSLSTAPETTQCFFRSSATSRALPYESPTRRSKAIAQQLNQAAESKDELEQKYKVNWRRPLGEGAFGAVYAATDKQTGHRVAVKKISKRFTSHVTFQKEMGALLHIRGNGGHPNICGLQENFEEHQDDDPESGFFYLVLDLVAGGEMFDHLCNQGAYSEAEAARMIREVASAMNFLHGIGIVHGDMKPENLMLSTKEPASAVVKVVDFGCAQVLDPDSGDGSMLSGRNIKALGSSSDPNRATANTPAYSAPEVLKIKKHNRDLGPSAPPEALESVVIDPSFDMWAVGVILYIMLAGVHPFDLYGNASDVEIEHAIVSGKRPPLGNSKLTQHLSPDAVSVIEQLLQWDPNRRLTAHQLLEHPWVRGETARTSKIAGSDKRLSAYRSFKTKLQAKAFAEMVSQSAEAAYTSNFTEKPNSVLQRTSLIELAFQKFDRDSKGFIPAKELRKLVDTDRDDVASLDDGLSLSGFSDILSDNMHNRYFPKGHIIYKEGEIGHSMYFLNSGSVQVFAKDGHRSVRNAGEFFGEGALLNPKKIRSASIRCLTPIHAIEISREYFEKYLASDEGLMYNLKEHDKARKRQRAKTLLQIQQNTTEATFAKGDYLFKQGEPGNELYVLSEGRVVLMTGDQEIVTVEQGEMTGEHSTVFSKPRNVNAQCISEEGCKALVLQSRDFSRLLRSNPGFKDAVREICLRREFQKALCHKIRKPFPKDEKGLREAFESIGSSKSNSITFDEIRALLVEFDPTCKEEDVKDILYAVALEEDSLQQGVGWPEFQRIFGMDEKDKDSGGKTAGLRRKKWKRGGWNA